MIHELKCWEEYFYAIEHGLKKFEVRYNDRDFRVADILRLQEYIPEYSSYTGRTLDCMVLYILNGGQFGIEVGYCIMSILVLDKEMK